MPLMVCVIDEGEKTQVKTVNGWKKVGRGDIVDVEKGYKNPFLKPYKKPQTKQEPQDGAKDDKGGS